MRLGLTPSLDVDSFFFHFEDYTGCGPVTFPFLC